MTYSLEIGSNREAADVWARGNADLDALDSTEQQMYRGLSGAVIREFENSHYQYELGLFTSEEYEARVTRRRRVMSNQGQREVWASNRETFAPSFRAEIDRMVAEVGG